MSVALFLIYSTYLKQKTHILCIFQFNFLIYLPPNPFAHIDDRFPVSGGIDLHRSIGSRHSPYPMVDRTLIIMIDIPQQAFIPGNKLILLLTANFNSDNRIRVYASPTTGF